jgi:hypothetical protein
MTIGGSLLMIAIGAILHYAVTATVAGVDIQTVGTILIVVGIVGLILGLFLEFGRGSRYREPPPPPV